MSPYSQTTPLMSTSTLSDPREAFGVQRAEDMRPLWAVGGWMRLAIVGLLLAGAGVAALFDPTVSAVQALSLLLAGVVIAPFAWQRTARLLGIVDAPAATRHAHAEPVPLLTRLRVALRATRGRRRLARQG